MHSYTIGKMVERSPGIYISKVLPYLEFSRLQIENGTEIWSHAHIHPSMIQNIRNIKMRCSPMTYNQYLSDNAEF